MKPVMASTKQLACPSLLVERACNACLYRWDLSRYLEEGIPVSKNNPLQDLVRLVEAMMRRPTDPSLAVKMVLSA